MGGSQTQRDRGHERHAFTLVELLVVIAIIGTLVGLLLPAVQAARESARRSACSNNLKQFTVGMQQFHDARGFLPWITTRANPPGSEVNGDGKNTARRTWLLYLWPYIEEAKRADSFNYTYNLWDTTPANAGLSGGLTNMQLISQPITIYYCPSDRPRASDTTAGCKTNYMVNTGTNTLLNPSGPFGWRDGTDWGSGVSCKVSAKNITDGLSKTLLFSEVVFASSDTPLDARGWGFSDNAPAGFMTKNTPNNGSDYINTCNNSAALPCTQTPAGNRVVGYVTARSRHSGGVGAANCDGSVGFVNDSIDIAIWQAMSTPSGGENLRGDF